MYDLLWMKLQPTRCYSCCHYVLMLYVYGYLCPVHYYYNNALIMLLLSCSQNLWTPLMVMSTIEQYSFMYLILELFFLSIQRSGSQRQTEWVPNDDALVWCLTLVKYKRNGSWFFIPLNTAKLNQHVIHCSSTSNLTYPR